MLPETLRGKLPQTQALQNGPSFVGGKHKIRFLILTWTVAELSHNFYLDGDLM